MLVKKFFFVLLYLASFISIGYAQSNTGVNTIENKALLQINALDIQNPSEFTGFSVPVYSKFSANQPSKDQDGMLMYLDHKDDGAGGKNGFYYWNNLNKNWEYIVQYKYSKIDLATTIAKISSFDKPIIVANEFQGAKFDFMTSSDPAFKIRNGLLVVGKTGLYQILLTGAVKKQSDGSNKPTVVTTKINVNGNSFPILEGKSSMSATITGDRFTGFTISAIFDLKEGDVLEFQTAATEISDASPLTIASPCTLMLMFLK